MLVPEFTLGSLALTSAPFSIEFGADLGGPETSYQTLISFLMDGEDVAADRVSNREISLTILVEGNSMQALAEAEALLVAEIMKPRNALSVDPGDGVGAVTVFDTFRGSLRFDREDEWEQHFTRRYTLTLPALPYPRSATTEVLGVGAAENTQSVVPVDSVTSNDGWIDVNQNVPATYDAATGAVYAETGDGTTLNRALRYTKPTGSGDVYTTHPYLKVRYRLSGAIPAGFSLDLSTGERLTPVAYGGQEGDGFGTAFFRVDKAVDWIQFGAGFRPPPSEMPRLWVSDLARVNILTAGGPFARTLGLTAGGTVRTQGSLRLSTADALGLGDVIVYTSPAGATFQPGLSQYGWPQMVIDSAAINGAATRGDINPDSNSTATIPAATIPNGRAQLWVRIKASTTNPEIQYRVRSMQGSTQVGSTMTYRQTLALPSANAYHVVCLGDVILPPTRIGPGGTVKITFDTYATTTLLDEGWAFPLDNGGALTVVQMGTSKRLWIEAPSLDEPFGAIWRGDAADRSDASYVSPVAYMDHTFDPSGTSVYTVTTGTQAAALELEHYRRWHSNAGS